MRVHTTKEGCMNRARKTRLRGATAVVLALVAMLLLLSTTACSETNTNAAALAETYEFTCEWNGVNGAGNICLRQYSGYSAGVTTRRFAVGTPTGQ
jgi:hypothetical protein